jgi:lysophospholipase L1-like esterase
LNWKLVSLVAFVACAAVAAWMTRDRATLHRDGRQFTLHQTLTWNSDPVIILGDSIVEASTLPRSICGHAIVNAGLNGASTASDLGGWLSAALAGRRAAAIVVSMGGNDAMAPGGRSQEAFVAGYSKLLDELSTLSPRLAVVQIVPVEAKGWLTADFQAMTMRTIEAFNHALQELAARHDAPFIALPAMAAPFTGDGTHLNAAGYLAWDQAVMQAAGAVCG